MSRGKGRTESCGEDEARVRLEHARKFLEAAELCALETEVPASLSVSASLSVLAGIAASDAACCAALGRRPRGQDHHEAEVVLTDIRKGGSQAARDLRRLLDLKDTAHYGMIHVSGRKAASAIAQARSLIAFAASHVAG